MHLADCKYVLFGRGFAGPQGKMMAHVFEELLSRHLEQVESALEQFSCLSAVDYGQDVQSLQLASSAFLNKRTFVIDGRRICIGTSYGMKQKQSWIRRLFSLCGEDPHQFQVVDKDDSTLIEEYDAPRVSVNMNKKEAKKGIRYRLFGQSQESSQAEMMYCAFEEILSRKPELLEWAVEHLHRASWTDFTLWENQGNGMPSQFKSCRLM